MSSPHFVIVFESDALGFTLYYTGWGVPKDRAVFGQFSSAPDDAKGYYSLHQARIGRTKLLRARPTIKEVQLLIKEGSR